jgi:drug/metabolite transporter (DMT)-like permease
MTKVKNLFESSLRSRAVQMQSERVRKVKVYALLLLVSFIWGSTFLTVQRTLAQIGPFTFLTMRFAIAALALALIFHKHLWHISRAELLTGSMIGVFLFGSYALQTLGLLYTTSSKVGFITGLYVPLVAILSVPLLRQKPTAGGILGVMLSVLGLLLISINRSFQLTFGLGELLVMGCALASALHVIGISRFAPKLDAINLAIVQIATTAVLSAVAMPIAGEPFVLPALPVWGSALFLGVAATAFALAVMNRVQQFVSSTHATLIYSLELVWAGLLGSLAGEQLTLFAWIGCASILLGIITAEMPISWWVKRVASSPRCHRR